MPNSLKPIEKIKTLLDNFIKSLSTDEQTKFNDTLAYFKEVSFNNNLETNNTSVFTKNRKNFTELVKLYLERNKKNLDWKERGELENYINFLRDYVGRGNTGVMKEIPGERNPNNIFPEIDNTEIETAGNKTNKSFLGRLKRFNPFKVKGGAIKLRSRKNKRSKRKTHNRKHV